MNGLMVTPKLIEQVRRMRHGDWWRVSRDLDSRFTARPISASVANRLLKLGWAEKDVQSSLIHAYPPVTFVRLNEAGMARAAEFDHMSEVEG
jgi:hypothetical protein